MRHQLLSFVAAIAIVAAVPAMAAEIDVSSQIDAVTVYPDGATVTRLISVDLPRGRHDADRARFSARPRHRVAARRGRGRRAPVTIGAIDARPPRPERPPTAARIERRIEALRDERAALDDEIARRDGAQEVRRAFAPKVAVRARREGRGAPAQRMARRVRGGRRGDRDRRQTRSATPSSSSATSTARLRGSRPSCKANPPRKMEVRIDLAPMRGSPGDVPRHLRGARRALGAAL